MTLKKLFVLLLSVVFVFGTVGLAAAQPGKKMDAEKKMEMQKKAAAVKATNAVGTIKAASADSVTVVGKDNKEWSFSVDPTTSIKKAGKAVTAADLKEGDPVHVDFTEADGKMMAKSVTVKGGGTEKKMEKTEKKMEKKMENPCAAKK